MPATPILLAFRGAIGLQALLGAACGDVVLHVIGSSPEPGAAPDSGMETTGFPPGADLAAYWGQNRYGPTNPEKPLAETCASSPYDIVIAAYLTQIASGSDGSPASFSFNLSYHCTTAAPTPDACDEIGVGIEACHGAGKKVLLSIGPRDPGLPSDDDGGVGVQAARSVWDMFLGGDAGPRPFGAPAFDGVDLDYFVPPSPGYPAFVAELRRLMTASGGRYYLTASPQCAFPDTIYFAPGGPVQENPEAFDALFVKFYYDRLCAYGVQDGGLQSAFQEWATVSEAGAPKIFVGLPVSPSLTDPGYVDRGALPALVAGLRGNGAFGGIMLLDVSYDQNSADDAGTTYGRFVKTVLQ
jgi:chitinase